ncbi:ABC transporter permease [Actinomadura sp. 6N118]|uniref:ABC transporter permease n=1 Tax=Actinomadura sp. 6N118 TaxID=3375151 RepID=UPI00379DB559
MTAITVDQERPAPLHTSVTRAFRGEMTKTRSVRSTYWTLFVAVVVGIGVSVLTTWSVVAAWNDAKPAERAEFEAVPTSMGGLLITVITIMVFGVLVITSEYAGGQIRISLSAVPSRSMLLSAKACVVGVVALAAGAVMAFLSFAIGQAFFATKDIGVSITDPGVFWGLSRVALAIGLLSLFAMAIGALVRHTAGAITLAIGGILLPAKVLGFAPESVQDKIIPLLPDGALGAMMPPAAEDPATWMESPMGGTMILVAWVAALFAGALFLANRRDA